MNVADFQRHSRRIAFWRGTLLLLSILYSGVRWCLSLGVFSSLLTQPTAYRSVADPQVCGVSRALTCRFWKDSCPARGASKSCYWSDSAHDFWAFGSIEFDGVTSGSSPAHPLGGVMNRTPCSAFCLLTLSLSVVLTACGVTITPDGTTVQPGGTIRIEPELMEVLVRLTATSAFMYPGFVC